MNKHKLLITFQDIKRHQMRIKRAADDNPSYCLYRTNKKATLATMIRADKLFDCLDLTVEGIEYL